MKSINYNVWKGVVDSKLESFIANGTWTFTGLRSGCKTLGSKWIFKTKLRTNGTIDKFKARLLV